MKIELEETYLARQVSRVGLERLERILGSLGIEQASADLQRINRGGNYTYLEFRHAVGSAVQIAVTSPGIAPIMLLLSASRGNETFASVTLRHELHKEINRSEGKAAPKVSKQSRAVSDPAEPQVVSVDGRIPGQLFWRQEEYIRAALADLLAASTDGIITKARTMQVIASHLSTGVQSHKTMFARFRENGFLQQVDDSSFKYRIAHKDDWGALITQRVIPEFGARARKKASAET